jgi:hypothetical protein
MQWLIVLLLLLIPRMMYTARKTTTQLGKLSSESEPCSKLSNIMHKSNIKWDSNQRLRQQILDTHHKCITEIIRHGLSLRPYFMIWGFQTTRSDMDRKWSAHGLIDVFGREMPISVERTLIGRQTRMIQDLEDERQEKLRKLR